MWLQIDITYKCFPFHWIVSNNLRCPPRFHFQRRSQSGVVRDQIHVATSQFPSVAFHLLFWETRQNTLWTSFALFSLENLRTRRCWCWKSTNSSLDKRESEMWFKFLNNKMTNRQRVNWNMRRSWRNCRLSWFGKRK